MFLLFWSLFFIYFFLFFKPLLFLSIRKTPKEDQSLYILHIFHFFVVSLRLLFNHIILHPFLVTLFLLQFRFPLAKLQQKQEEKIICYIYFFLVFLFLSSFFFLFYKYIDIFSLYHFSSYLLSFLLPYLAISCFCFLFFFLFWRRLVFSAGLVVGHSPEWCKQVFIVAPSCLTHSPSRTSFFILSYF